MKTKATSRIFKQTFAWILAVMMVFSIFPATQVNAATKKNGSGATKWALWI